MHLTRRVGFAVAMLCASPVWAHEAESREAAMRWSWEPFVVIPLLLTVLLYGLGTYRMWRRGRHTVHRWALVSFVLAMLGLVVALDSPIHLIGGQLFWVHMTQHELLMLVAAPLMVLARPLVPFLWALPTSWREAAGRFSKSRAWMAVWVTISSAFAAWAIHAVALWIWHAPSLFEAALHNEGVHAVQHLCFFGSALLFWWTLLHGRHGRLGYGAAIVYVFTTAAHNSVLGALLTFAPHGWYPSYLATAPAWSISPLEDQQLGGLIMWVPAGVLLLVIGLALVVAWIAESQRRFEYTRVSELVRGAEGVSHAS